MILHYDIADVASYINWTYFYFAWQLKDPDEQQRLRAEAERLLADCEGTYHTHAIVELADAYSDGDDIVVSSTAWQGPRRLPFLRQQQADSDHLCLADFIAPEGYGSPIGNRLALFATSTDGAMATDFDADPYRKLMAQLLADRLAEATAERLHQQVRRQIWGYAPAEQLTIAELHREQFQGIRPAVGYPSLPDASMNFLLDELLHLSQIGINLTESGAMRPHASVSGLMLAHPAAHYFSIGPIGADQLADYAHRRGLTLADARRFLNV